MESLQGLILNKQIERKPITTAPDMISELVMPYEKYIVWNNDTYLDINGKRGDRSMFYMQAKVYAKHHTLAKLKDLLEWIKTVNCLRPKQVLKALEINLNNKSVDSKKS